MHESSSGSCVPPLHCFPLHPQGRERRTRAAGLSACDRPHGLDTSQRSSVTRSNRGNPAPSPGTRDARRRTPLPSTPCACSCPPRHDTRRQDGDPTVRADTVPSGRSSPREKPGHARCPCSPCRPGSTVPLGGRPGGAAANVSPVCRVVPLGRAAPRDGANGRRLLARVPDAPRRVHDRSGGFRICCARSRPASLRRNASCASPPCSRPSWPPS